MLQRPSEGVTEGGKAMPKIVILGSCRYEPYIILFAPNKVTPPELYNTEEGYKKISRLIYAAIDNADEIWVYIPDGIGEHTTRDLEYAKSKGKIIRVLGESTNKQRSSKIQDAPQEIHDTCTHSLNLSRELAQKPKIPPECPRCGSSLITYCHCCERLWCPSCDRHISDQEVIAMEAGK